MTIRQVSPRKGVMVVEGSRVEKQSRQFVLLVLFERIAGIRRTVNQGPEILERIRIQHHRRHHPAGTKRPQHSGCSQTGTLHQAPPPTSIHKRHPSPLPNLPSNMPRKASPGRLPKPEGKPGSRGSESSGGGAASGGGGGVAGPHACKRTLTHVSW